MFKEHVCADEEEQFFNQIKCNFLIYFTNILLKIHCNLSFYVNLIKAQKSSSPLHTHNSEFSQFL